MSDTNTQQTTVTQPKSGPAPNPAAKLVMTTASQVKPEKITWLWKDKIPYKKLTLFVGNPGLGKSLASVDVIAKASKGAAFPDTTETYAPVESILFSLEDDANDTIVPRLMAAGADLDKIHIVQHVRQIGAGNAPQEKQFSIDTDLPALEQALKEFPNTRVLVIDPVTNHLGKASATADEELRPVLSKLAAFVAQHNLATILITHFNKGVGLESLHRIAGGVAMVAVVRIAWAFIETADGKHLMLNAKSNVSAHNVALGYSIEVVKVETNGVVLEPIKMKWGSGIAARFSKALADSENLELRELGECQHWLKTYLASGEKPATEITRAAETMNCSDNQIRRASERLNVKKRKDTSSSTGKWLWSYSEAAQVEAEKTEEMFGG